MYDHVTATSGVELVKGKLNDEEERRKKLSSMLAKLTVIDPNFWPSQMDDDYGEQEVRQLCEYFSLHSAVYEMRTVTTRIAEGSR